MKYLLLIFGVFLAIGCGARSADRIGTDAKGRIHVTPLPMDEKFKNAWTPELEVEFWTRADAAIKAFKGRGYGNLFFENEKNTYPLAMMDFLAGNRDKALKVLQQDDVDGYNSYTNMVDFYPCFTIKGQMRKYFFFGEYLDPAYKKKMFDGAKIWTENDPATRKHPTVTKDPNLKPGENWAPAGTGVCVDTRNTDNLRAMRECAVYLFAEETGNKEVAAEYKKKIQRWVGTLYSIGMGEWDSSNYLGHTYTGYINLYDFAKDPEVRLLGKAAMDWISASAAVKYWRGDWGGPDKRDYGGKLAYGSGASNTFSLFFGDCPAPNTNPERDDIHLITSNYRPPVAVMALARKQFKKPVTLFDSKPTYSTWHPGAEDKPEFFETLYFGNSFQFGTLSNGSSGDTNGFKLMTFNSQRGTDDFYANTGADHSGMGVSSHGTGGDNIAQNKNSAIFLSNKGDQDFQFFLPKSAVMEKSGNITFIRFEKTWVALFPINLNFTGEPINPNAPTVDKKHPENSKPAEESLDQILTAKGTGGNFSGFAMEIGEMDTHGDFAKFKTAMAKAKLDVSALNDGTAEYTSALGEKVKLKHTGNSEPGVWLDGVEHDWKKHWNSYANADGSPTPIHQDWKSGKLHVEAGGYIFDATLGADGKYSFTNSVKK